MKIIDKQGRLFGKVSVIDLLVVVAAIVLALGFYTKNHGKEYTATATPSVGITYEISLHSIREESVDMFRVGDEVFDEDNENVGCIGTISAVRVEPGTITRWDGSGQMKSYTAEHLRTVVLTIEAEGMVSQGRIYVNRSYEINKNSGRTIYTKYATGNGMIVEITV